ncbi:MAG: hypothetical protein ACLQBU_04605 [Terriglobales bacterium]
MKRFFAAIAITLALVGCQTKPTDMDAERLLPKSVQAKYNAWNDSLEAAKNYDNCLSTAHNDISAKYCEKQFDSESKLLSSAWHVDLFMQQAYRPELDKLWKQHPKSKAKQDELAKKEADMQEVLLDYDRGRCAMNDGDYATFTVATCADLQKQK